MCCTGWCKRKAGQHCEKTTWVERPTIPSRGQLCSQPIENWITIDAILSGGLDSLGAFYRESQNEATDHCDQKATHSFIKWATFKRVSPSYWAENKISITDPNTCKYSYTVYYLVKRSVTLLPTLTDGGRVCTFVCLCVCLFFRIIRYLNKKLRYRRGTAQRAVNWCCTSVQEIAFESPAVGN